jgi:hypothetical protein
MRLQIATPSTGDQLVYDHGNDHCHRHDLYSQRLLATQIA